MRRVLFPLVALTFAIRLTAAPAVRLPDLDNRLVDPIRAHVKAFNYPVHALRDPNHELVKLTHVLVTPEVAVFDRSHALVYHGRIDDRYVSLGVERPSPTRQDLADALTATLAGTRVREATTQAVGCFIADFVQ